MTIVLLIALVLAIIVLGAVLADTLRRPTVFRELETADVRVRFSPPAPPQPQRGLARGTSTPAQRRRLPGMSGTAELASLPQRYPRCHVRVPPKPMDFSDTKPR